MEENKEREDNTPDKKAVDAEDPSAGNKADPVDALKETVGSLGFNLGAARNILRNVFRDVQVDPSRIRSVGLFIDGAQCLLGGCLEQLMEIQRDLDGIKGAPAGTGDRSNDTDTKGDPRIDALVRSLKPGQTINIKANASGITHEIKDTGK